MTDLEVWMSPWYNAMVADIMEKYKAGKIEMDFNDLYDMIESLLPFAINFEGETTYSHDEIKRIMGVDEE